MPWLKALLIVLPLYAVTAAWSQWSYVDPRPPGRILVPILPPVDHLTGRAFKASMVPGDELQLSAFADEADAAHQQSPVLIYEGNKPLAYPHSKYDAISNEGDGHFALWKDQGLIFSTSDNTDPNTNGRRYWAVIP